MENEVLAKYIRYMVRVIQNAQVDYLREVSQIKVHEISLEDIHDTILQEEPMIQDESLIDLAKNESWAAAFRMLTEIEDHVLFQLVCLKRNMVDVAAEMGIHYNSVSRIKLRALRKLHKEFKRGGADD